MTVKLEWWWIVGCASNGQKMLRYKFLEMHERKCNVRTIKLLCDRLDLYADAIRPLLVSSPEEVALLIR